MKIIEWKNNLSWKGHKKSPALGSTQDYPKISPNTSWTPESLVPWPVPRENLFQDLSEEDSLKERICSRWRRELECNLVYSVWWWWLVGLFICVCVFCFFCMFPRSIFRTVVKFNQCIVLYPIVFLNTFD